LVIPGRPYKFCYNYSLLTVFRNIQTRRFLYGTNSHVFILIPRLDDRRDLIVIYYHKAVFDEFRCVFIAKNRLKFDF
jgi:hypothetical protein